jgi:hypothetical protein
MISAPPTPIAFLADRARQRATLAPAAYDKTLSLSSPMIRAPIKIAVISGDPL